MADVVIVGGGIGGLASALLLGRQGRDVVVCERDVAGPPPELDAWWLGWSRSGVAQWRLSHTFLALFRTLLRERAPDVLAEVLAAGAPLVDLSRDLPGGARCAADAEMSCIMCRRPVLEGVLRRIVEREPTVEVRSGSRVEGLLAEPSSMAGVPRVTGVRVRGGAAVAATTVIVSGGRTLPIARWLVEIGAQAPREFSEGCGSVGFGRHFQIRLRPGEDHSVSTNLTTERDPGFMNYEIYGADRATFSVEFDTAVWDRELRGLRHEDAFMAAARLLPEIGDWLDAERASPLGPVSAIGQERNVLRHFTADGRPSVLGLHVIGDARCQLNSAYAWGSGVALAGAVALSDVLAEHRDDPEAQALALEARIGPEIEGRHAYSLARDRARRRMYLAEPEPAGGVEDLVVRDVLPAVDADAALFRAVMRWELQLDSADALAKNAAVLDAARVVSEARRARPDPPADLSRETVVACVRAHAPDQRRARATRGGRSAGSD